MRINRRAFGLAAAAAATALVLAACGQESTGTTDTADSAADDGETPVIGLVMKSLGNPYFQAMQTGAEAYDTESEDFELRAVGIQSETDIAGQVEAVNNLVAQGVDAIVIAPADSIALVAPLIEADAQGISIVNIDVKLDDDALEQAGLDIPFVGPDNVEGARQVGMVLAEDLGEGAKVAILEGIQGAANAEQRKEGFEAAVAEGGLDLVASNTANWETEQANTVFTNILGANPDIQGVMAANDSMALGALAALEASGQLGEIKVVGFDNVPEVEPYLADGSMLATLDQFGSDQAVYGIDVALDLLAGEQAEDWVKTDIELITGE
ncbi:sugar ABC transporter substrate-binding protein [Jiangella alkaliphila]|uniref:Monosaccharide ABC transporter substrate-binding protein, CUT2 family n=1 Tax=Jiangella alkaliphila TaxID=419479 RepID=A0A1H2LDB5_9ACTN|nr:sugar ABC transporter substrate-binding protein [Jiangella alkaliphila]SDU79030.1 monosaccharide ABC transporter substrate-binding protein, CUT2 family [Jiangella alkaliphila]